VSRFPVAFRLPAFASRSSCSRRGVGPSLRSAYRARPKARRTPTGLPRSARVSCDRGGCPLYPEDGGAPSGQVVSLTGACRFSAASPCTPLQHPILRGFASRGINGGSSNSPVRSSPRLWPPGWNGPPLGFPPSFAPRRQGADDARRGGDRPASTGLELRAQHHISRSSNRVVHSQRATSRRTTTRERLAQRPPDACPLRRAGVRPSRVPQLTWPLRRCGQ
jgi:hypothetical protein